jgi:uncharacterized membrane protein YGL010W
MKTLDDWLIAYGQDHTNRKNQLIHKVCVPAIFFTVVGSLHLIPFNILTNLAIGDAVLAVALFWYFYLSKKAFFIMLVQVFVSLVIVDCIVRVENIIFAYETLATIFVIAWVGQFYGHHIEGKRPSFVEDLKYLLIGPLWVFLGNKEKN